MDADQAYNILLEKYGCFSKIPDRDLSTFAKDLSFITRSFKLEFKEITKLTTRIADDLGFEKKKEELGSLLIQFKKDMPSTDQYLAILILNSYDRVSTNNELRKVEMQLSEMKQYTGRTIEDIAWEAATYIDPKSIKGN